MLTQNRKIIGSVNLLQMPRSSDFRMPMQTTVVVDAAGGELAEARRSARPAAPQDLSNRPAVAAGRSA